MPSVNFELRDSSFSTFNSSMSIVELKGLGNSEQVAALQRHFLHYCDILRKNEVDNASLLASLLGGAVQDYIENACLQEVERARRNVPGIPPTYVAFYNFLRAFGSLITKMDCPPSIVGLAMANAGMDIAGQELSGPKILNHLKAKLELLAENK